MKEMKEERLEMVKTQLQARDITDKRVLQAMFQTPRHLFLPEDKRPFAYVDKAVAIEAGQTMSQPYVVAYMVQALQLQPTDRVLDIGTGSGYAAAVLSCLVQEVVSIERHLNLAQQAQQTLHQLGYHNIRVLHGDGTRGYPQKAPFEAIVAAAGGPDIPSAWLEQLAIGGRLVMPVGAELKKQVLVRVYRHGQKEYQRENLMPVRFVPLIGHAGWSEDVS